MQQIAGWLEALGLGQYAPRFAENDINFAILCDLTDQDLKELGVSSLGHRRQLLRAIAELNNTVEKGAPKLAPATAAPVTPQPHDAAERRQLTVMFCDLVGSTALSARLDPEDMREIVGAYHRSCAEQIAKAGGFVAKYMGDGVLAYFGYPQAHEHDAERAVLAGLALVEAVPMLKTAAGTPLQVRVGIATGLVVVGDLDGSGEAQERGVVGDTPNLAARLQGLAEPNMVVIAEGTRRLLGNLFELEDLGAKDLKGIAGPVRAWAALRASSAEGRFEALHTAGLTALVGREEELELLLRRWSRAKRGEGQVVLLSGEAGIGKSRLTAALLERLSGEAPTRLRYFCSPQHTDSALYPIIRQMERAAGLAHDDKPQVKIDKLDAVLAQSSTSTQDAALFAEMLSLANDARYPALELTPEQRRQRTLEALTAQLAELSRQQPVLMIFEDAHWVDPTSLEVLGRTVDRIKTLPALLIVTFRPEFTAPWVGQSHVTSLTLNRLGEREAAAIIARLVGNKALPAACAGGNRGAHRRHSPVRGGDDKGGAGGGERGRGPAHDCGSSVFGPGGAGKLACLADGAARPARPGQGGGAGRGGDRAPVLLPPASFGGMPAGGGARIGVGPSHYGRLVVPAGRAAARHLPLQACPGAGHGLCHSSAQSTPGVARAHRQGARRRIPGDDRCAPRNSSSSLLAGRPSRSRDRVLGARRRAQRRPICSFRGGRSSRVRARSVGKAAAEPSAR